MSYLLKWQISSLIKSHVYIIRGDYVVHVVGVDAGDRNTLTWDLTRLLISPFLLGSSFFIFKAFCSCLVQVSHKDLLFLF
jgi:hypothetical protein